MLHLGLDIILRGLPVHANGGSNSCGLAVDTSNPVQKVRSQFVYNLRMCPGQKVGCFRDNVD